VIQQACILQNNATSHPEDEKKMNWIVVILFIILTCGYNKKTHAIKTNRLCEQGSCENSKNPSQITPDYTTKNKDGIKQFITLQ
jgi:hypothetical protein